MQINSRVKKTYLELGTHLVGKRLAVVDVHLGVGMHRVVVGVHRAVVDVHLVVGMHRVVVDVHLVVGMRLVVGMHLVDLVVDKRLEHLVGLVVGKHLEHLVGLVELLVIMMIEFGMGK